MCIFSNKIEFKKFDNKQGKDKNFSLKCLFKGKD